MDKWLNEIKVGQEVLIESYGYSESLNYGRVTKITPKRRDITVSSQAFPDLVFENYGRKKGERGFGGMKLTEATEENKKRMRNLNLLRKLYNLLYELNKIRNRDEISIEDAQIILKALQSTEWHKKTKETK